MKPQDQARVDLYKQLVKSGQKAEASKLCQLSIEELNLPAVTATRIKRRQMTWEEAKWRMRADLDKGRNVNGYSPEKSNDLSDEPAQEPCIQDPD